MKANYSIVALAVGVAVATAVLIPNTQKAPQLSPESLRFKAVEQSAGVGKNKLYLLTDKSTHEQYLLIENTAVIYLNSLEIPK